MVDESDASDGPEGGEPSEWDRCPSSYDEAVGRLDRLVRLHSIGQLSSDEFQLQRQRLLESL